MCDAISILGPAVNACPRLRQVGSSFLLSVCSNPGPAAADCPAHRVDRLSATTGAGWIK